MTNSGVSGGEVTGRRGSGDARGGGRSQGSTNPEYGTTQLTPDAPTGVAQVLTPSGLAIYYQAGPKRLYRIRETAHAIETDWEEVPSVSTVLGVLDKPALVWWGMRVGVEGVAALFQEHILAEYGSGKNPYDALLMYDHEWVVEELKRHKLTVNHQRDKAADRGTNVHSALEAWAETGVTPDPQFFPENERGYVQGLVNFLRDAKPQVEHSELMVASLDGFAGRFDLVAQIDSGVVTKTYPKKHDVVSPIEGRLLIDMKTSKDCYPSHHLQLAAYWRAMGECGYGVPDTAAILRVTDDGRYELVECRAIYEDFKRVLDTYNSIQRIKGK